MKVHELKTWPSSFKSIQRGQKNWELRHDDRGYEEGDLLWLREWNPNTMNYTKAEQLVEVLSVWDETDVPAGLVGEFVIMDIRRVKLESD